MSSLTERVPRHVNGCLSNCIAVAIAALCLIAADASSASAQTLNWEGQTGVFVTPLAYTLPSQDKTLGKPALSYHYLNAGEVLGGFHQFSVSEGALNRLEFGYTRSMHNDGSTAGLSQLWSSGFNIFQAKANVLGENLAGQPWLPAVSIGLVARTNVQNVGGVLQARSTKNSDVYAVATKTITQIRKLPLVLSFGYKGTNASLLGISGNSPAFRGRAFGSAVAVVKGPGHSTVMLASELLQQPREIEGLPGATMPTTITYAIRIVPAGTFPYEHGWGEERPRLSIDIGVAQAAGNILPNVNLRARHQFALGISYGF